MSYYFRFLSGRYFIVLYTWSTFLFINVLDHVSMLNMCVIFFLHVLALNNYRCTCICKRCEWEIDDCPVHIYVYVCSNLNEWIWMNWWMIEKNKWLERRNKRQVKFYDVRHIMVQLCIVYSMWRHCTILWSFE